ncbi:MAG: flagellar biosynthetic protein FliR [Pirellulales bacterium]|nr:flagellar biosynthetic protein FliR [Pirellulales bacterium]
MAWLNQFNAEWFLLFTLILTRVSGLTMTAPAFGSKDVPVRIRVLLALALAVLVFPLQRNAAVDDPGTMLQYLALVGGELLIGAFLGLGVMLLLHGIELAGELIASTGGLMLADVYDPTADASIPIISRFFYFFSLSVFLCIGGHRLVMAGLLDTFQTIPPGRGLFSATIGDAFFTLLAQSFSLGLRVAAPAVTALLVTTLVMGLISRTVPQLNILIIGFGMNALLTLAVVALTLGTAAFAFQSQLESVLQTLLEALQASVRGEWFA